MLKQLMGALWRGSPKSVRRLSVIISQARFTVTAAGVIEDDRGRILLLKHRFRTGSGWGIPGGFINKAEQPEEALRRELSEEIGLELESAELVFLRTLERINQVEIYYRCRAAGRPGPPSMEISRAAWFTLDDLPQKLSRDQREIIDRVLKGD
jgi:8-oxo-dGTP diphosphatase